MRTSLKRVGFWQGSDSPALPHPIEFVDATWSAAERAAVATYLKSRVERVITGWRGYSHCRICGCSNGSEDLSDHVYLWPSGYVHYIESHNVRPPQAFIDHVLRKLAP